MDNYTVLAEKWPDILDHIKTENDLTAVSFSTWIEPLVLKAADHAWGEWRSTCWASGILT